MPLDENALDSLRIDRNNRESSAPRRSPRWALFSGVGVLVAAAIGLFFLARGGAVEVETAPVQGGSGSSAGPTVLNASGYVVARRQATVAAKVTGKVVEVLVEEGTPVEEGALLARLDDSSIRPQEYRRGECAAGGCA